MKMFGVYLYLNLFIITVNLLFSACSEIPQTVLCADEKCREPISEAQALVVYMPSEKHVLGFKKGTKIQIICKSKEKNGYWGGKIGNKIGFVPASHVKEVTVWKNMDMLKVKVPASHFLGLVESEENDLKNSALNVGKGSEKQISGIAQDSSVNPQSNNSSGDALISSSELLIEKQNLQLNNVTVVAPLPVDNTASNSPKADPTTQVSDNLITKEFDAEKQLEMGGNKTEESVYQTISNNNNDEKEGDNLNAESGEAGMKNLSIESESNSAEKIIQEQIKLSEKVSAEPDPSTDTLNESSDLDSNEESESQNQTPNLNIENIVELKEDEKNESSDVSNKLNTVITDSNTSVNGELENHIGVNKHVSDNIKEDIVSETQVDSARVPVIVEDVDPSFIPGEDDPVESENGTSLKLKNPEGVSQNILPNHNREINVGTEFKTDSGTVNEINVASSNNEVNVDMNGSLAHNNMANASAVISSSSNSSSSSSTSSGVSGSPPASNSENNTSVTVKDELSTSALPPHQYQEDINTIPNVEEVLNAKGAQMGHKPEEKTLQNDLNPAHKPSSTYVPPIQVPPYNFVRQRELYNTKATPPANIEVPQSAGVPIRTAFNSENNQILHKQFDAPTSESLYVKEGVHEENQEAIHKNEETASEEKYNIVNETDDVDGGRASTEKNEMETVEKPFAGSGEATEPENVQVGDGEHFHDEIPVNSPAEADTDVSHITEDPSEDSNFEDSTPSPSVHGYQNSEEKTIEDMDAGQVPSEMNSDKGFFSNVGETLLEWVGLGSKKQEPESKVGEGNHYEETVFVNSQLSGSHPQEQVAAPEESCQAADGATVDRNDVTSAESNTIWNFWLDNRILTSPYSYNTFIYLVVTAVTVLLFTLGYYFIEKFRSDGPLIAKVNRLEQELLVSSKECLILRDELSNTKEMLNLFETSSNDKIITSLQQELEEAKKIRAELENNVDVLQQELDAATEAGLDLNRMLSEVLTQKGGSETLMESVEHLQAQLNNQQKIIDEMTSKLFAKTNENQELQDELTAANEKIESLESEIEDLRGNLNVHLKDNEDVIKDLTAKNNELQIKLNQVNEVKEKEAGKLKKNLAEFEKKLKATCDSLKIKEEECNNLKDSVKKIKVKDGKNIDSLFETSRIKAELSQAASENNSLKDRLKAEEDKVAKLDVKVKKLEEEVEKLKHMSSEAEKEKTEAQTRLEVLSNYFKEKETQLQKELGLREAMWVQKQGDDSTIYERMKSLEEEINSFKSQNEALKKEILDQERGLKAQITNLEKKAHENWIAARQAERKLEETKQEAAQLRNKMTLMEKNITNDLESSQHHRVNDELNGGDALSPLIHDTSSPILFPPPLPIDPNNSSLMPPGFIPPPMFMPPPPGGFMPPPPPFLPGDHRPPPLGRMSSPPLNNRFSPPPPEYAYDRMSTPPLSPSNRNYRSPNEADRDRDRERFRHRTPTSPSFRPRNWEEGPSLGMSGFRPITSERDSRREQKGGSNLSSGHSSDSLDKSSRHSSRV